MTKQTAWPSTLNLPQGVAHLVIGSAAEGTPRYLLDGEPIDVDVTIPPDLLAAGWFWNGSFLRQQLTPNGPGISIYTGTFPPPGIAGERGTCFDAARKIEETRARMTAEREAGALRKAAKRPKRTRQPKPDARREKTYEQQSF